MAEVKMTLDEYHDLMRLIGSVKESEGAHEEAVATKKKRKVSKYQKAVGKHMKALKARKYRGNVMKESHRLARKQLGMRKSRSRS